MTTVVRTVLALFLLCIACSGMCAAPAYDISVRLDPATRELNGTATIVVAPGAEAGVALAQRFKVSRITLDGVALAPPRPQHGLATWTIPAATRERKLAVRWSGQLAALDRALDHRQTLEADAPVAGDEGSFLPASAAWYPRLDGLMDGYRIAIDVPGTQRALVPGRLVEEKQDNGRYRARFEFPHPAEGIDLMAGPYRIDTRTIEIDGRQIALRTYFHPQIAELAAGYLDSVKTYIERYSRSIGPYPYSEFSVVSSPTPTGFGMPTLTYLGIDVLRLPFIRATSLGHEVLHNWWGNGVYPDYAHGNWSEGLTTFMADYAYKEDDSADAARAMRLEWLRDFAAVPPGQDAPLAQFTSRTHGTSQIVGYGKAAMVFLMLRDLIGADAFDAGIRRFWRDRQFKLASWNDLQNAFAAEAKRDLSAFFTQWLTRAGAPRVVIEGAQAGDAVHVKLAQSSLPYALDVPLAFRAAGRIEIRRSTIDAANATLAFKLDAKPDEVLLDPDLRLFRRLERNEAPPILRETMVDPAVVTVIVGDEPGVVAAARTLAEKMQDEPPRLRVRTNVPDDAPLLVIGLEADVVPWLQGRGLPAKPASLKSGSAAAWTATSAYGKTVAVVTARDAQALAALARPLPHYGRRSYVIFDGGKAIDAGVWPARAQSATVK